MGERVARARARANIALAKYWGKSDDTLNLPAVPSISMTLDPLLTETSVRFDGAAREDAFVLDGQPAQPAELSRVSKLLDEVRRPAGLGARALVESRNLFPTAAGLASSASGFAALAAAAVRAAGLSWGDDRISALARRASASAARSVYGGFVELPAGQPGDDELAARPLAGPEHWDVRIIVAITARGRKPVVSTSGMNHTRDTSPYYAAWLTCAPELAREVRAGVLARDLPRVGSAMEHSTLAMHASAIAAAPGVLYWLPGTVAVVHAVRALRQGGVAAWFTIDAGPHVKVLCEAANVERVRAQLDALPAVERTLVASPGAGVEYD